MLLRFSAVPFLHGARPLRRSLGLRAATFLIPPNSGELDVKA